MRGLITAVSPASPRFPSGASEPDRPAKKVLASRLALLPLMALLLLSGCNTPALYQSIGAVTSSNPVKPFTA